jgi:hypothetical protein
MAQLSALQARVGYKLGYTMSTNTHTTTTQATQFLNDAVDDIVAEAIEKEAWEVCRMLQKEVEYPLIVNQEEYSVYTVIGDSTDFQAIVSAQRGDYECEILPITEYHEVIADGNYYPSVERPFLIVYEYGTNNMPKFRMKPIPSSADTLYFRYLKYQTAMSASDSTPSLPTYCDELIVLYAAAVALIAEGREEQGMPLMQLYEKKKMRLIDTHAKPKWRGVRYAPIP